SRRRHTRFSRDWSSDVCSSDLFERQGHGDLALVLADVLEFPQPVEMAKRTGHELDIEPMRSLERVLRREALVDARDADIDRRDHVAFALLFDPRAAHAVQELRIGLDVVDEIEHLGSRVRHPLAAVNLRHQTALAKRARWPEPIKTARTRS